MKVLKFTVWLLWLMFFLFIVYAVFEYSKLWMIGFFLWFVPAYYIIRWIENGILKEIQNEIKK